MKIRIVGSCGSGKTFLAKYISEIYNIPFFETDNMIWNRVVNEKFSLKERNERLINVINLDHWIIEGAQYKWSSESFEIADLIIILNPHPIVRNYRVIKRFIEMNLGLKQYNYKQSWTELIDMNKQNCKFDKETFKTILLNTEIYKDKRIIVKNKNSAKKYLFLDKIFLNV